MAVIPKILIADRDIDGLTACLEKLQFSSPCTLSHVFSEDDLQASLADSPIEILILDLSFPVHSDGISLVTTLRTQFPKMAILPIIPAGQPHLIKQLLALDLFFYIHKPIDPVETRIALKRVYETLTFSEEQKIVIDASNSSNFHGMIGATDIMQQLFDMITRVADDDVSTVLIRGESGTGKEMVAKAIHAESRRRNKNFVPVNCAAIPDDLLESELFGYTKGAFTGAAANKIGRIQYADQGTLFLDEIGDMKASLQAKLLRVIQEKEFEPVGALKSIPVNTRILAATHCDLEKLVNEGKFREDLYYRISVIPLNIPALKERAADIPLIIDAFVEKYARQRGREPFHFSPEAMAAITYYEWRGNVRELENLIQHMSILYSGKIVQRRDLPEKFHKVIIPAEKKVEAKKPVSLKKQEQPDDIPAPAHSLSLQNGPIDFNELINDFETQLIIQAMKLTEGNKKEAARLLSLKRTTLLEKIKKKDIEGLWEKS
ncbi:MAG: sigma-54 dependent transcriptional regulator [Desulforhopalus sp.]|nr:sigma-54 dependent transcriptional regulator [Desulforhopalus sp.]